MDVEVQVPLWLAVSLKQKQKCKIIMPNWLNVESLSQLVQLERTEAQFQPIEFYYIEISLILFER